MTGNLLSILSHVVHGYVGNRASVFPLQCCGWEVDAIHTTDFLNHPGYGLFQGSKTYPETTRSIISTLGTFLNLLSYYHVIMVGYCPSADVMAAIYGQLAQLIQENAGKSPKCTPVLVVDPVLGDNGRMYVPQEVVEVHKGFLKQGLVDLTTPNQFELEILSGISINSWKSVCAALRHFHAQYAVPNVVLLSVVIDGKMYCVGFTSSRETADSKDLENSHSLKSSEPQIFSLPIELIDCRFSGCGDVFTALLTHEFYSNNLVLSPEVLTTVLVKLHHILNISYEQETLKSGGTPTVVNDIRLIQLKHIFEMAVPYEDNVKFHR